MSFLDNKTPISGPNGFQTLSITISANSLDIPPNASSALIQVKPGLDATDATEVLCYSLNGLIPEIDQPDGVGFYLGKNDYLELTNLSQLQGFKYISASAEAGEFYLAVQYFES
jgi:hypothetical protein